MKNLNVETRMYELIKGYNIRVNVNNINEATISKIEQAIEVGTVKERQDKEGALDIIVENGEMYLVFVKEMQELVIDTEDKVKDFANHNAKVNGTYGKLGATPKQISTLKMFVYKYKVSVAISPSMTREEASNKITELYKAVSEGLLIERDFVDSNYVVKNVNNVLKLVKKQVFKSSDEYINGFDEFNQTGRIRRSA